MQLFKQEWKKCTTRDAFFMIFLLCFLAALRVVWFRVYHISYGDEFYPDEYRKIVSQIKEREGAQREKYLSKLKEDADLNFAKRAVVKEWNQVDGYEAYLEKIQNGGSGGLQGLQSNPYQDRIHKIYHKKYQDLTAERVHFIGGRGISLFCHTDVMDGMILLLLLLVVIRLVVWETESGMGCISAATRNGAYVLTRTKWLVGMALSLPVAFILMLYKLFVYASAYGFTEWGSAVQALPAFSGVNWNISVGWFLVIFMGYKLAGYLFLYTIIFGLSMLGQKMIPTVVLQAVFLGISYFFLRQIPLSGYLAGLRYFSPLQCIDQEFLLGGYRPIKLFSYPVSYLGLWQAVSVLLFLVVSGFICTRSLQREQGKWISSNMAYVLAAFHRKRSYRIRKRASVFWWEGRKGFLYERSVWLLVIAAVGILVLYRPPREQILTAKESCYQEVMRKLEGSYTAEKKKMVQKKLAELTKLEKDVQENGSNYTMSAMQVAQEKLEQKPVYQKIEQYLEYISQKKDTGIVYEKGWLLLWGRKIPGGYLRWCQVLAVLLMVLMSAGLWGEDRWQQTDMICRASCAGIRRINRQKMWWNMIYGVIVGILVYVPWIYACGQTYSLKTRSFSAASIPYFESVPFLSLGSVIFCSYLLRVLYLILVGCVTKMVQSKVKSRSLTIYVSLLLGLIPVLLL